MIPVVTYPMPLADTGSFQTHSKRIPYLFQNHFKCVPNVFKLMTNISHIYLKYILRPYYDANLILTDTKHIPNSITLGARAPQIGSTMLVSLSAFHRASPPISQLSCEPRKGKQSGRYGPIQVVTVVLQVDRSVPEQSSYLPCVDVVLVAGLDSS